MTYALDFCVGYGLIGRSQVLKAKLTGAADSYMRGKGRD